MFRMRYHFRLGWIDLDGKVVRGFFLLGVTILSSYLMGGLDSCVAVPVVPYQFLNSGE